MDYTVLERSTLFHGINAKDLRRILESVSHHIQCYDKDEVIFHLMEEADRIGIILEGRAQAQKPFPNGSQVNVSIRNPGLMVFRKKDLLQLMQKDIRILENFTREIASATYMLQQRLELLSYSGIAQKAAFYLLMQRRKTGSDQIRIPDSVTKWSLMMNVSRPSLHRELKRLEAQGIISYHSHIIEILDPDALQTVLG